MYSGYSPLNIVLIFITDFSSSNLSDGANFNAVTITLESMILSGRKSLISLYSPKRFLALDIR